jgi:2-hydroxy-3-oxopropionate reductase
MRIGFVGLGLMGGPMVRNLLKAGFEVRVCARRLEVLPPFVDQGALACATPADVARESDIVISMVPDAPEVRAVALGPGGVVEGAQADRGLIFIDMSTIAPPKAQEIASELATHGITMLDAPVSGGEIGAIQGRLTIMVGGPQPAFNSALPVLQAMGQAITHIGPSGAGQVAKACNQILTGVGVVAVAEAFHFAQENGVAPATVRQALMGGLAASRILENHGLRMVERRFEPGFKAWMHQKDLRIVMEEAHRLGLGLPASACAAQLFNAMQGQGLGEEDSVAVLKVFEKLGRAKGGTA